jgi:hypothetical protein
MRVTIGFKTGMVLLVVAGLALVGGGAYAVIPTTDGVLHGCYNANAAKMGGAELYIIDDATTICPKGKTALTWNGKSPTSYTASGQSCASSSHYVHSISSSGSIQCAQLPPARPKVYDETLDTSGLQDVDAYHIPIGALPVPTGRTVFVTAHVTVSNIFNDAGWQCYLRQGTAGGSILDESETTTTSQGAVVAGNWKAVVALQTVVTTNVDAAIWMTCTSTTNEDNHIWVARISAIEVSN